MSDQNDGFESVGDSNPMWNPRQTGSAKNGNFKALEASDKSWVTGHYLGCKTGIGENNATVHSIQMSNVGDKAHVDGDIESEGPMKIDFWGSGVLDSKIADNIAPGMLIRIVWKGLVQPKKQGGKPYHGWDVQVNHNVEPIAVASAVPSSAPTAAAEAPVAATEAAEDDDLPF